MPSKALVKVVKFHKQNSETSMPSSAPVHGVAQVYSEYPFSNMKGILWHVEAKEITFDVFLADPQRCRSPKCLHGRLGL